MCHCYAIGAVDQTYGVGVNANMKPRLLLRERRVVGEGRFAEMAIWKLPKPVPGSQHPFKYRLAFVVDGVCVLRFDNESGKGDHKHVGAQEVPYAFTNLTQLVTDFLNEIDKWSPP
jgi:Family of unknown function (DUF6516)